MQLIEWMIGSSLWGEVWMTEDRQFHVVLERKKDGTRTEEIYSDHNTAIQRLYSALFE